jgi:enoyl-CoA hydratase
MADEILTQRQGKVLLITLNRPEARNAVNLALATGLAAALDELDADDELSVGVLTGEGKGFSAGMDLKAFVEGGMPTVDDRGFAGITERSADKPLIAAVEGFALAGGLEIALSCDIIVAASNAKFGIPEAGVGLFAGAGALLRLPRRVPYGIAMKMALSAAPISAVDAERYGLVDEVVEPATAVESAMALAEQIAGNAPLALRASKALLRDMQGRTEDEFWKFQAQHMTVFASSDATEGATAFAEKRAPHWKGE